MRCLICKVTDSEVVKFLINCIWYSFGCIHLSKDCYLYFPLLIATYSIVSKHFNDLFFFFHTRVYSLETFGFMSKLQIIIRLRHMVCIFHIHLAKSGWAITNFCQFDNVIWKLSPFIYILMYALPTLETSKSDFRNFCTFGLENNSLIWFLLPYPSTKGGCKKQISIFPHLIKSI